MAEEKEEESLEGWATDLAGEAEVVREAMEKAFGYRGDVTLALKDGRTVEGYVFDRKCGGRALEECWVRVYPKEGEEPVTIRYSDIVRIQFTGRDAAAGKSFQTWMKKYLENKAR